MPSSKSTLLNLMICEHLPTYLYVHLELTNSSDKTKTRINFYITNGLQTTETSTKMTWGQNVYSPN
jgi:hypothetical protein